MKRFYLWYILICLLFGLGACHKANLTVYNSPANVYFDFTDTQRDSLLYSFALDPSRSKDTIYLPVRLSGVRVDHDRKFIVKIDPDPDSTTAIAGKHYQPLDSVYIMAAGSGISWVPLIVYNQDTALQSKSVQIRFSLLPTTDFDTSLNNLIRGRLVFSSKLERPDWWGMWMGDYFSQIKFQLFIIVTNQTAMTTNGLDAPKNLYFVSLLNGFLSDPVAWIKKNPAKGYVLEKQVDGNYYFYKVDNPGKKIAYKYDAQANAYFFIDENGQEVN